MDFNKYLVLYRAALCINLTFLTKQYLEFWNQY